MARDAGVREAATPPGPIMVGLAERRPGLRLAFIAITLFFTIWPFVSVMRTRPEPVPLALLLVGWATFGVVLALLFRVSPFGRLEDRIVLLPAIVILTTVAVLTTVVFGLSEATALYYYAGVSSARLVPSSWSLRAIAVIAVLAGASASYQAGDPSAGVAVGVTVGTISLTLSSLSALARLNRELEAARHELAETAVAEERARIARDLHDTLGHSLSVIALKSELARRVVRQDPDRAEAEIGDVERTAREALASVRDTVTGYRQPTLAMELAGAREALRVAGIDGRVEPAPEDLPRHVDALLGWAVREGVTNVLRHSEARRATIRVLAEDGRRGVEIVDDGRGDGDEVAAEGNGLAGLRERASRLGGAIEAARLPGGGFRLCVSVPVEEVSA